MQHKPLPRVTKINQPFLDACNKEHLVLQHCQNSDCGKVSYYPRVCCPHCGGGDLEWKNVEPFGRIISITFVHRPQHAVFEKDLPIPFAAVELDAGPLIYAELVNRPDETEQLLGARVEIVFRTHSGEQKLPYFELNT